MPKPPIDPEYAAILARLRELLTGRQAQSPIEAPTQPRTYDISASAETPRKSYELPKLARKELGELGELAFMHIGRRNGIPTAKPYGDTLPFDQVAVAIARCYRLHKVQVRCTAHHKNFIYGLSLRHAAGLKPYKPGDFDYLAALVFMDEDYPGEAERVQGWKRGKGLQSHHGMYGSLFHEAWYIIPYRRLPKDRANVYFHPHATSKADLGPYDRYRDRWDLLR